MSVGLGIDIVEVKRFASFKKSREDRFLTDNYSKSELEYCFAFKDPAPHLAGTFAAKEAAFKAMQSAGRGKGMLFSRIEVRRDKNGRPVIYMDNKRKNSAMVSISHTAGIAAAAVIFK